MHIAMAPEANFLSIDNFDTASRRSPLLADLKPNRRYIAVDLDYTDGGPLLIQRLVAAGLADGQQMTPSEHIIDEKASMAYEELYPLMLHEITGEDKHT